MITSNRLNLRQVEAFRAVMLTGKVTSAAELLLVTQPAVSRLVADFERATQLRLFERRGNRLEPTRAAYALMNEVDRSFVGLERISSAAAEIARSSAGTLRIVAMPALANGILARYLARFLRDRAGLRVTLDGLPSASVIERMVAGSAEIGYADGLVERPGLICKSHFNAAVLAMPAGHRLADKTLITADDLAGERLIRIEPGTIGAKRIDVILADVSLSSVIETQLSHSACSMVLEGAGVALIETYSAGEFASRGLVMRPFTPQIDAGFTELLTPISAEDNLVAAFVAGFAAFHRAADDAVRAMPES